MIVSFLKKLAFSAVFHVIKHINKIGIKYVFIYIFKGIIAKNPKIIINKIL